MHDEEIIPQMLDYFVEIAKAEHELMVMKNSGKGVPKNSCIKPIDVTMLVF